MGEAWSGLNGATLLVAPGDGMLSQGFYALARMCSAVGF